MSKVVAGFFTSLDGVVESPNNWHFPYYDGEVGEVVQSIMMPRALLGRRTYEEFAEAFAPMAGDPFADQMAAVPKLVVSSTLEKAEWGNATVLGADWADVVRRERAGDGPDIGISGSTRLVRGLLAEGLLDELHLMVHPVVLGKGERLFTEEMGTFPLPLASARTLRNGTVVLSYAPEVR